MTETWLPAPGLEGFYEVSDLGRIRSIRRWSAKSNRWYGGKIRKITYSPTDYAIITVSVNNKVTTKAVAQLVMRAFVGEPPAGMEVCHNDSDKTNNCLSNLRYDTHRANEQDKLAQGRNPWASKTHCPRNHPYDEDNTIRSKTDGRTCRICRNESQRLRYHLRRGNVDEIRDALVAFYGTDERSK